MTQSPVFVLEEGKDPAKAALYPGASCLAVVLLLRAAVAVKCGVAHCGTGILLCSRAATRRGSMQRWGQIIVVIGAVGIAGIAAAHEGQGGSGGGMPPEVKAIKEKYHGLKQQLHQECQQKLEALKQQEHQELEAAMKAAHDKHVEEMKAKHDERMKHKEETHQEHKAQREQRWQEHHQKSSDSQSTTSH